MRCQQLVHNIANDRAFNPLSESWDRNGENYPSFVLSSSLTVSFLRVSISVLETVSWDLREYWEVTTLQLIMMKTEICLNWIWFFITSLLLSGSSSLCELWGLSLIIPDAEVQVILALILFSPLTSHHLLCPLCWDQYNAPHPQTLASVTITGHQPVTPV